MKYLTKLILIAVAILACSSCHKKDFPDNLTCIPKNATLVANVNLEKLIDKANIKDFKKSGLYTLLNQDLLSDDPSLRALLEDPDKSGIAFKQAFAFVTPQNGYCISLELKDAGDFKDAIEDFIKEENMDTQIYKTSDFYFLPFPSTTTNSFLMWDKHKALLFTNEPRYDAEKIFKTTKETSILQRKDYVDFYKSRKDISVWAQNSTLYDLLSKYLPFMSVLDGSTVDGTYSHLNMEFLNGEIHIENKQTPLDSVAKMDKHIFNSQPDNDLLNYLPSNNLIMMKTSLNMNNVFEQLGDDEELKMLLSPRLMQTIHSIRGDMVVAVLNTAQCSLPQVAVGLTTKDPAMKNVLLNEVYKSSPKKELGGYSVAKINGIILFIGQKGPHVLISNNENIIKLFVKGQRLAANMATVKVIKDSPAYLYANLDFNTYPLLLRSYIQSFGLSDRFNAAILFKSIEAKYAPQAATSIYTIRMKDNRQNSLALILNEIGKMN